MKIEKEIYVIMSGDNKRILKGKTPYICLRDIYNENDKSSICIYSKEGYANSAMKQSFYTKDTNSGIHVVKAKIVIED